MKKEFFDCGSKASPLPPSIVDALTGPATNKEIVQRLNNLTSILETICEKLETIADVSERLKTTLDYIAEDTQCLRMTAGSNGGY